MSLEDLNNNSFNIKRVDRSNVLDTNLVDKEEDPIQPHFLTALNDVFNSLQEKLNPIPGMPPGVYTLNPVPDQTWASLNISNVDSTSIG